MPLLIHTYTSGHLARHVSQKPEDKHSVIQQNQITSRMVMESSYLDMLPDEMLLKIIHFALRGINNSYRKHDFLVGLARTSQRLKRLSQDRSLKFYINTSVQLEINREETTEEVKELIVKRGKGCAYVTAGEITDMAGECPKVEELTLDIFTPTWPILDSPWSSLRKLVLNWVGKACLYDSCLDMTAPNLEYLSVCGPSGGRDPIYLPDMTRCEKLREVCLKGGEFDSKKGMCNKVYPFPPGLRILSGRGTVLSCDEELLKMYFEDCLVSCELKYSSRKRWRSPRSEHSGDCRV